MKKQMHQIKGLTLNAKQMKELKGGMAIQTCTGSCTTGTCTMASDPREGCGCKGATGDVKC